MNKILLQCDNLCKRYQEGTVQTDVLHNVSFSVGEGEMMAIVGSSGSGKSTLLHLLGGLDTPTAGDVIFSGQPMSKMSSAAKAELRNRELGFIYQFHHLLPEFSALDNVAMPLRIRRDAREDCMDRAAEMLRAVGLGEWVADDDEGYVQRVLQLEFELALVDYRAVGVYARVIKIKQERGRWIAGMEFTDISEECRPKVQMFVQLLVASR